MSELTKFKKNLLDAYADAVKVLGRPPVIEDGEEPYIDCGKVQFVIGPLGTLVERDDLPSAS